MSYVFGCGSSTNEVLQSSVQATVQSVVSFPFQSFPSVVEDEYGIFIRVGDAPSVKAELHEAMVEVYRSSDGKIVAIDIVYDEEK